MKFTIHLIATIFAGFLFSSFASAQKIEYDFVPGTDYSKYKTYKWHRADDARYPSDEIDRMIIRSVDAQLKLKGMIRTEDEACDMYVIYQLAITEDMKWSSFRTEIGWQGTNVTGIYDLPGGTTNSSYPVSVGSLFLDFYDVAQKKRVWVAHATKTIHPSADLKKNQKNTDKVMAKVLKNYPPVVR